VGPADRGRDKKKATSLILKASHLCSASATSMLTVHTTALGGHNLRSISTPEEAVVSRLIRWSVSHAVGITLPSVLRLDLLKPVPSPTSPCFDNPWMEASVQAAHAPNKTSMLMLERAVVARATRRLRADQHKGERHRCRRHSIARSCLPSTWRRARPPSTTRLRAANCAVSWRVLLEYVSVPTSSKQGQLADNRISVSASTLTKRLQHLQTMLSRDQPVTA